MLVARLAPWRPARLGGRGVRRSLGPRGASSSGPTSCRASSSRCSCSYLFRTGSGSCSRSRLLRRSCATFSSPAESALLPTLVDERELVAANALNALNDRLGRLAGAPLGGLLLAQVGLEAVIVVDAATFLAAAALIAPIHASRMPRVVADATSAWNSFLHEWLEGLRLVGRDRTIALLFFVFGLMTFSGTMLDPLTVAWVRDVLDAGPEVFAWILTVHAASGILGSLFVGSLGGRFSPRALMGWGSLLAAAALGVRHNLPYVALALAMSAVVGVTSVASSIGAETLAMQSVRDEFRGRVFGSLTATLGLLSLAGAVAGGLLGGGLRDRDDAQRRDSADGVRGRRRPGEARHRGRPVGARLQSAIARVGRRRVRRSSRSTRSSAGATSRRSRSRAITRTRDVTRSSPGARDSRRSARGERPLEPHGRVDQADVRERLREVADLAGERGVVLLGEQPERRCAAPAAARRARRPRRRGRRARGCRRTRRSRGRTRPRRAAARRRLALVVA